MAFSTAEEYFTQIPYHPEIVLALREIVRTTELEETLKWGTPTYTLNGRNVVSIGSFKSYSGLWFHQGVFLSDPKKVLINASEDKTRGQRQWRMSSMDDLDAEAVKTYVLEAIENQKAGKEIKVKRTKEVPIPPALEQALEEDPAIKEAFERFTPGKQKEFAEHIATAKREETVLKRLDKILPMIREGVGLNDKYRNC